MKLKYEYKEPCGPTCASVQGIAYRIKSTLVDLCERFLWEVRKHDQIPSQHSVPRLFINERPVSTTGGIRVKEERDGDFVETRLETKLLLPPAAEFTAKRARFARLLQVGDKVDVMLKDGALKTSYSLNVGSTVYAYTKAEEYVEICLVGRSFLPASEVTDENVG